MTPTFSICHATLGRAEKAVAAMFAMLKNASLPTDVEYIFAVNQDDDATLDAIRYLRENHNNIHPFKFVVGDFAGSVAAWCAAARVSNGHLLVQQSDDISWPTFWDAKIVMAICGMPYDGGPNGWQKVPLVVSVPEHYRKDALMTAAVCNRARYEQQGEFLHEAFRSVFSDDDFTIRALADAADGKCMMVKAPFEIRHEHNCHNPAVPHDSTYAKQNASDAYALGGRLFFERNAALVARGFKTW